MATSHVALGVTLYILPGRQSAGPLAVLGLVIAVAVVGVLLRPVLAGLSPRVSITWWGHATTTIELGGRRILTDPVLTRRLAHLSRISGPVPGKDALRADAVVISHLHLDHLHAPSLTMLGRDVRIVAPNGTARALSRSVPGLAGRVEEVEPGDTVDLGGVRLRAVAAAHDGRPSPVSRHRGPSHSSSAAPAMTGLRNGSGSRATPVCSPQ